MKLGSPNPPRGPVDALGKLLFEGKDVTDYLFQVPDDESQRERLRGILTEVIAEARAGGHHELPRIAAEVKAVLDEAPSAPGAGMLQAGFDRLLRLWQAARSGLF